MSYASTKRSPRVMKAKICDKCKKNPNTYSRHKCNLCKIICCCHMCKYYEDNMDKDDKLLSGIDYYWYVLHFCNECVIKLINHHQ